MIKTQNNLFTENKPKFNIINSQKGDKHYFEIWKG